ncbi:anti-sigma factor [Lacinutrix salivirga]
MNTKEYIESGILELYVAGALSEKENQEIYELLLQYPELLNEVLKIEAAILKLTAAASPKDSKYIYSLVKEKLGLTTNTKVVTLNEKKSNWFNYSGWAAALVLGGGLLWMLNQNNELKSNLNNSIVDKEFLEAEIDKKNTDLTETKQLLNILRDTDLTPVPLAGQPVYPEAYAKAYWDKDDKKVYLDLQGLPEPPEGKVYQVWSLTLNPLTPTSLGTVDDFVANENKIFTLNNPNESQAFGITLEPAGGSVSPTLEQLYTLGVVEASS